MIQQNEGEVIMMPDRKPKTKMEAANKGAYKSPSHGGMENMKDPSYNSHGGMKKKKNSGKKNSRMNY